MDFLYKIVQSLSLAYECVCLYFFPPSDVPVLADVHRMEMNRYKVVVHFPDRDVAIQFKRPRGPVIMNSETTPEALLPYLQNDRQTPILVYKVPKLKE